MAYTGDLLKIKNATGSSVSYNGRSYSNGSYVPLGKLITYNVGYQKLWSSNTGRGSMTGEMKGTLTGIFTKLTINFGAMYSADVKAIIKLCNVQQTDVTYYDIETQAAKTEAFYFGDVIAQLERQSIGKHTLDAIDIVAVRRRS